MNVLIGETASLPPLPPFPLPICFQVFVTGLIRDLKSLFSVADHVLTLRCLVHCISNGFPPRFREGVPGVPTDENA